MSYSLSQDVRFSPSNLSAFGTLETAELAPVVQLDFTHGINTQTGVSTTASGGTVDTNAGRLRLQSGTSNNGSAIFNSRRTARYRPGQGTVARFTAVFSTGTANSTQIVGAGNSVDGYFFGYSGTSFGILHRINSSDAAFTAQASWNGDKCNGTGASAFTIDPTKGNVYMVKYPYLGYGDIQFFIQDSVTGRFLLVHTIRYANTVATVQVTNPNLFFYAQSLNGAIVTNQTIYVGSVGFFISGERSFVGNPHWATDNNKTGITAETVIFSLKNATTYNTAVNRGLLRLHGFSAGAIGAGTPTISIRFRIGATVGGAPSFATINGTTGDSGVTITSGNSIASVDVAGTTATAGLLIYNMGLAQNNSVSVDLTPFDLYVAPTEILTISGFATASSAIVCALNWSEDI